MLQVGDIVDIGREGRCVVVRVTDCGAKAVQHQGRLSDPSATYSVLERGFHISAGSVLPHHGSIKMSNIINGESLMYDRVLKEREYVLVPIPGLNPPAKRRRVPRLDAIQDEPKSGPAEILSDMMAAAIHLNAIIAMDPAASRPPSD